MKQVYKHVLSLIVLEVIILLVSYILISVFNLSLIFREIAILTTVFSVIALLTLFIFFKGQTKTSDSQTLHILVAISLKFFLEMIFALLWFLVVKKCYKESVLMFFVLYLTLTLFTIQIILKTLKNKVL